MKPLISRLFLLHPPQCPSSLLTLCPTAFVNIVNTTVPSCSYRKKSGKGPSSSYPGEDVEVTKCPRSSSLWSWQTRIQTAQGPSSLNETDTKSLSLRRLVLCDDDPDNKTGGEVNVRVRSSREERMVEEWVAVLEEIQLINQFKQEDVEERLELAKQRVLCEMEKLKTAESLDGLDLAIESALSSEVN